MSIGLANCVTIRRVTRPVPRNPHRIMATPSLFIDVLKRVERSSVTPWAGLSPFRSRFVCFPSFGSKKAKYGIVGDGKGKRNIFESFRPEICSHGRSIPPDFFAFLSDAQIAFQRYQYHRLTNFIRDRLDFLGSNPDITRLWTTTAVTASRTSECQPFCVPGGRC